MRTMERYHLLKMSLHKLSICDLHQILKDCISSNTSCVIVSQNMHGVYVYHRDAKMQKLHQRRNTFVRIDGMPLIFLGRLLGHPFRREHRVTWVDWVRPLMAEAVKHGWRIFYLGAAPGVAELGAENLRQEFSGLQIATADGFFDTTAEGGENLRRLQQINAFTPHILIVGMGMPRQEHWILDNFNKLNTKVILTSGAAIEYVAGVVSTPPRWMGRWGCEWLYRFLGNPKRFWRRYLLEPRFVLQLFLNDVANVYLGRGRSFWSHQLKRVAGRKNLD
jgi:N-acetylglucosaminyldiphosphoundecaprenol N-acetyl-beta-D-mannosaminyltransferase